MTHKVHPIGYRLGITKDWKSRWLDTKQYSLHTQEDYRIREFITKKYKNAGIETIEIERSRGKLLVIIATSRPGILIGRGGSGIEDIRSGVIRILHNVAKSMKNKGIKLQGTTGKTEIRIEIREIREADMYATLVAQNVAEQLEKRMPFRRTIKRSLERVMSMKGVEGAKILVKGRLDGAEMARREFVKDGKLPLQKLRADIDFAHVNAHTTYGVIGVKVWLYKGEKLD